MKKNVIAHGLVVIRRQFVASLPYKRNTPGSGPGPGILAARTHAHIILRLSATVLTEGISGINCATSNHRRYALAR